MLAMVGLSGLRRAAAGPAVRRPAAAGRPGPGPGHRPARACCSTSPLSALDRNLRDTLKYSILDLQRRTGKTADLRHPRPVRGVRDLRPDRRDERRAGSSRSAPRPTSTSSRETPFVAEFIGANNGLRGTVDRGARPIGDDGRADGRASATSPCAIACARAGSPLATRSSPTSGPRTSRCSTTARTAAGTTRASRASIDRVIFEGADRPAAGRRGRPRGPGRRQRRPARWRWCSATAGSGSRSTT